MACELSGSFKSFRMRLDMNVRRQKGDARHILERMAARCKGVAVIRAALNMMHETMNV